MIDARHVLLLALGYVLVLFAIAWLGDRTARRSDSKRGRPVIYALSLGVYCTSWTFFGSVGLAAATGWSFIPVYLGPILMFVFGWPLVQRIVRLAKSQNLTSVADFLAARYGKSPAVAAIVTLVAVVGVLPYIALQLKAISASVETLLGASPFSELAVATPFMPDTALVIALALALFAILFGTRHIDATEHQDGLMLAIAAESLVKLAAFIAVGVFVVVTMFGGLGSFATRLSTSAELQHVFGRNFNGGTWLTVTFLSLVCIILLPRQFHVAVVENHNESEIRRASWMFPLYLVAINLFVVPIAAAGLLTLPSAGADADMLVLALPLSKGADAMAMLAFIGGLSAATAMVIVDSVALAIMVCNGLAMPLLLRRRIETSASIDDVAGFLLPVRRVAIVLILLLGYATYRALGQVHGLATIGLVSFAAVAQLAPAFFIGLVWRRATARGAIAGILAGFAVWVYTLLVPWTVKAGWLPVTLLVDGPFAIGMLRPEQLFFLQLEPLPHGVLWSMLVNILTYVSVSLMRLPEPIERLQAHLFVLDDASRPVSLPAFRLWRTSVTISDLQATVSRYLGAERTARSFAEHAESRGRPLRTDAEADVESLQFTERLLTSAIGAASARIVLALLLRRSNFDSQSALKLLDDATEALQYNRDLLQSALDQVRHGLTVFDRELRLVCWNRQYRELLGLPEEFGRVGVPLDQVLRHCAVRGDLGGGPVDKLVAERLGQLADRMETFQLHLREPRRIVEVRTRAMPQGGFVTTYTDITERVEAADALARANETLERRVADRTAELLRVNQALEAAKARADEANLDKTRFLAAASHDILQPLNAARLYASSLVERNASSTDAGFARNIDASLAAVEEILGALLDIARLDTSRMAPEITVFPIADVLAQLEVEFRPMARERGLELRFVTTSAWVASDRRLLRRVLQNLLSNAIKYTQRGGVIVGCRRRGEHWLIAVSDTGPGIPAVKHAIIFKEFERLAETATAVRGLGLGLSIVERITRILGAAITLRSIEGHGSTFAVRIARADPSAVPERADPALQVGVDIAGTLVLCIDDEQPVLDGMQALLAGWGCGVLLAASCEDAIRQLAVAPRLPDVIVADYHLREGTGLDAVAAVHAVAGRAIPVIIATAEQSDEVQREIRRHGFPVLRKPLRAAALRSLLAQSTLRRSVTTAAPAP